MTDEMILVIPTEELPKFDGFHPDASALSQALRFASYRPRSKMETDPSFKQLIPYVIFRHGDDVFAYTRGAGQGESRLHAKRSIGIGGHISQEDGEPEDYETGMFREIHEEVKVLTSWASRCVGLINDDSTPVGQVHMGVVHIFDVDTPDVIAREVDICDAGFVPVRELLKNIDQFENWSQICLRSLFGGSQ